MESDDPHELQRFVDAQRGVVDAAVAEIRGGRKRTHWMWFVFPQIAGLGSSGMAQRYAIRDLDEARAYLDHELLGPRLILAAEAALAAEGDARSIFGSPDDVKLRSSMTLFAQVAPPGSVFHRVLDRFFGGVPDPATLQRL